MHFQNLPVVVAIAALLLPMPCSSAELNVPVAARLVSFLQPAPTGSIPAAIIYQPGNAASEAEAAQIERRIGRGLAVGRATIHVSRVSVSDLSALSGKRIAFVTSGIRSQAAVAAAASRGAILTITSDISCVQAGHCVVGVTGAKSQITVNRAAARAAKVRFGSAFLMLVKEI